jgi:thiamine-phosphate pyrophosphorylase
VPDAPNQSITKTANSILCYVTDRRTLPLASPDSREAQLVENIRTAIAAGIDWIQIRENDLQTRPLLNLVTAAVAASRASSAASRVRVIVNDRLDIALAAGASGVHLGESSVPVGPLRELRRPPDFVVGASCHSRESAVEAEKNGADYVIFGPVFATPTKAHFGPPQGLLRLAHVCQSVRVPVLAIGGITPETFASCVEAGAAGVAAIRLFQAAGDLAAVVRALR